MDAERSLLYRAVVCGEMPQILDLKVTPELFLDEVTRKGFKFVRDYYLKHNAIPPMEVLTAEVPELRFDGEAKGAASYYVEKMAEQYIRSQGQTAVLEGLPKMLKDPMNGIEWMLGELANIRLLAKPSRDVNLAKDPMERWKLYEQRKNGTGPTGLPYPWEPLNRVTLGLHEEEFAVIVGSTGIGKTWTLCINAVHWHNLGAVPLILTKEMSVEQMTQRIDAVKFKLPYQEFRAGLLPQAAEQRYLEGLKKMEKEPPIHVVQDDGIGVEGLAAKIDQLNPDVILVDGLYMMQDRQRSTSLWERVMNISAELKELMQKKRKRCLATTQFNRAAEGRSASSVSLANVGYSYALAQYADLMLGIFRNRDMELAGEMAIRAMKHREGENVEFTIRWDLHAMEFPVLRVQGEDYEDSELASSESGNRGLMDVLQGDTELDF